MHNWSRNIYFEENEYFQPESLIELQDLVRSKSSIRARGSAHSFNEIANTKSCAINLAKMPKVIEINQDNKSVLASAGLTYGELAPALHKKGWALSNLASLPHISIAGSISTGTHGSGIRNKNLANQVKSIRFIDHQGQLHQIEQSSPDFNALVIGLGLGGIVYQYELSIEPTFQISQVVYPDIPIEILQSNFEEIMGVAYSVSFFTDWSTKNIGNLWCKFHSDENILDEISGYSQATQKYHPIPSMDPIACTDQFAVEGNWYERLPHFKIEFSPSVGDEIQSEFFIDRKDAAAAIDAISKLGSEISPLLWITELRTIAADELWLSGAFQRETLGIHFTWKKMPEIYAVISKVEQALLPFNYRPHWGKAFSSNPSHLHRAFPRMSQFFELIQKIDPEEKFYNEFVENLRNI